MKRHLEFTLSISACALLACGGPADRTPSEGHSDSASTPAGGSAAPSGPGAAGTSGGAPPQSGADTSGDQGMVTGGAVSSQSNSMDNSMDNASAGESASVDTSSDGSPPSVDTSDNGERVSVSDDDCKSLISDPTVNWRQSPLKSDQEIVTCLARSLGQAVGYGEHARGGYDPAGDSKLTIITKSSSLSVEQQIADAVGADEHNWIVFDKADFAEPYEIGLYRLQCGDAAVQAALGVSGPELCIDYRGWCAANGVASERCLATFFNERLNDSALPLRNIEIGSNTTLDGRQSSAYFLFSGFAIGSDDKGEPVDTASSVILTNLRFQGAGHTEDHALDPDMIRSTGASHDIWIHQNTFELTGDSAFDVKVGAYNETISFNLVKNVKRATLHGSSDSRTINSQITTTLHHNAFVTGDEMYETFGNTARRVPLIRRGKSHLFNNLFYNYRKDVLSVRAGAQVLFEDNMFLVNRSVAVDDDLDYFAEKLLEDYREGGLEVSGSRVWWSDAACSLDDAASGDLAASRGTTASLSAEYGADSHARIGANRFSAGRDLAAYVLATAGKGGTAPFNSPYTPGTAAIMQLPRASCQ